MSADRSAQLVADVARMLEELPVSEAIERIVTLTCERDNYRLIAQQAIHQLHQAVKQRDRLRQQRIRDAAKRHSRCGK